MRTEGVNLEISCVFFLHCSYFEYFLSEASDSSQATSDLPSMSINPRKACWEDEQREAGRVRPLAARLRFFLFPSYWRLTRRSPRHFVILPFPSIPGRLQPVKNVPSELFPGGSGDAIVAFLKFSSFGIAAFFFLFFNLEGF